jgi:hypothetical protein
MLDFLKRSSPVLIGLLLFYLFYSSLIRSSRINDFQDYYQASVRWEERQDIYSVVEVNQWQKSIKDPSQLFQGSNPIHLDRLKDMESGKTWEEKIDDLKSNIKPENLKYIEILMNETGTYIYPPIYAFILSPLSSLSYNQAALVHSIIQFICLLLSLILISRNFSLGMKSPQMLILLVISFRFLENHTNNNQVGFLILFLSLLSLYSKNDLVSGLILGLAISIKLTPVAFLFYFFWKKRYKVILYSLIGLGICLIIPGISDWAYNLKMLEIWKDYVLKNFFSSPLMRAWKNNQSLPATLGKFFHDKADPLNQHIYHLPFFIMSHTGLKVLSLSFTLILVIPFLISAWFTKNDYFIISSIYIFTIVFSGISWVHSFVYLVYPYGYLINKWKDYSKGTKAFLIFSIFLSSFTTRNIFGSGLENLFMMFSVMMFGALVLYLILVRMEFRGTPR